jgi:NAD+ kinase
MGYQQRPVLGVNLGRLGFLAALQPEQLELVLPEIAVGRHQVNEHLMIECSTMRSGRPRYHSLGLNEASVLAGPPFAMVDIELYVDGELVTTYSCDGLIVSTPIGSTAHSLSAGGPILRNNMQALVIVPISPHTLTHRPVVDSADRVIELAVPRPLEGTSLVVDGHVLGRLDPSDRVRIVRSQARFQMVEVHGQSYYRTLHDKLGWSGQIRRAESGGRRAESGVQSADPN